MNRIFPALLGLLALLCGCEGEAPRAWVAAARADSAAAEAAAAAGDDEAALRRLGALLAREVPAGVAEEDARVVRQDACDRVARIHLARGDAERAMRFVRRGLELGEGEDVFTANLIITRGRAHEASGRDRDAAEDYARAIAIQEALLERALGGERLGGEP